MGLSRSVAECSILVVLAAALLSFTPPPIRDPGALRDEGGARDTLGTDPLVSLGERLFSDVRLSSSQTTSCASCHLPDRSFTDGRRHAVGQRGESLGKNTATLLGLGSVPSFQVGGSLDLPPRSLSLEERVVESLRTPSEMNASVEFAINHLCDDAQLARSFDDAFGTVDRVSPSGEAGVTPSRLAKALAAYVRSLRPPESRGLQALEGRESVLSEPERRGLYLFYGAARCQACHPGTSLTDGQSHVVATFREQRRLSPAPHEHDDPRTSSRPDAIIVAGGSTIVDVRPASEDPAARVYEVEFVQPRKPWGPPGNATFESVERQTLSLLDVARTSPYFRDGSVARLDEAVRRHVAELREIGERRIEIARNPALLLSGVKLEPAQLLPRVLSDSAMGQLASDSWVPSKLSRAEMSDIVSFLESLSPAR